MASSLTTRMKKSQKSGNLKKKMGNSNARGAKSRRKGEQLTRGVLSDSSQMEIKKYFTRKNGIIGTGIDRFDGRIPLGDAKIPL